MPISAAELARLRAAHTAALRSVCNIRRKTTRSTTNAGGPNETWTTVVSNLPCRLMPENSRRMIENLVGKRESMTAFYRLTVPFDADLRPDDEVIFGGDTYQVMMLWDDHDLRTARRVMVAKTT